MNNAAACYDDTSMNEVIVERDEQSGRVRPKYCPRCGHSLLAVGEYCSQCGLPIPPDERLYEAPDASPESRLIALLLCVFLGYFGVHRFYVGKIGTGILWALTGGLFGIGYVIDIILIATGSFRDAAGLRLLFWD